MVTNLSTRTPDLAIRSSIFDLRANFVSFVCLRVSPSTLSTVRGLSNKTSRLSTFLGKSQVSLRSRGLVGSFGVCLFAVWSVCLVWVLVGSGVLAWPKTGPQGGSGGLWGVVGGCCVWGWCGVLCGVARFSSLTCGY